ncbi:hypothetical protein H0H81_003693, partial [Sphagnurus paluster]
APGEAEAELAWMSRAAIIDVVLSEDSDVIVFGAKAVLHIMTELDGRETVKMYESADITVHLDLKLELCDLVFIAILAGGDYDPGLDGCSVGIAFALARAGLGKLLVRSIEKTPDAALHVFLGQWRAQLVAELISNSSGFLSQKQPNIAASVPANFPDINTICLYTHLLTSEDAGPSQHPSLLATRSLDLPHLIKFAEDHFLCADHGGIHRFFALFIFPGLAVRQLMSVALSIDLGLSRQPVTILNKVIALRSESESSGAFVPEARVSLLIDDQNFCTISDGRRTGEHIDKDQIPELRIWLPVSMIQHVQPGLLAKFAHRQHQNDIAYPTLHDVIDLTVLPEVALPSRDLYRVEISVSEDSGNEILEFFTDSEAGDEEADTALIADEKDSVE